MSEALGLIPIPKTKQPERGYSYLHVIEGHRHVIKNVDGVGPHKDSYMNVHGSIKAKMGNANAHQQLKG